MIEVTRNSTSGSWRRRGIVKASALRRVRRSGSPPKLGGEGGEKSGSVCAGRLSHRLQCILEHSDPFGVHLAGCTGKSPTIGLSSAHEPVRITEVRGRWRPSARAFPDALGRRSGTVRCRANERVAVEEIVSGDQSVEVKRLGEPPEGIGRCQVDRARSPAICTYVSALMASAGLVAATK